jgi:hypothetical protein
VDQFKDFFKLGVNRRDRKPIIGGTDLTRKHVNVVPAKYKKNNNLNKKIETLKKQRGKFFCDQKDLDYIKQNFLHGRQPNHHEMKMLGGKMGIKFYYDRNHNKWIVEK